MLQKFCNFFRLEKSDWKKTERGQLNLSRLAEKFSEGFSSLTWKKIIYWNWKKFLIEFFCPPLKFKLIFFPEAISGYILFLVGILPLDLVFSPWCGIGAMVVTQEVEHCTT